MKKAKGVPKSLRTTDLSKDDYVEVLSGKKSRTVNYYCLKRKNFKIYLIKSKKRLLTKFNCKRFFIDNSATFMSQHSFPLHFKRFYNSVTKTMNF